MSDSEAPTQPDKATLAKATTSVATARQRQRDRRWWWLWPALVVALGYTAYENHSAAERERDIAYRSTHCRFDDASCIGSKWHARAQRPCSDAVEQALEFEPEWTDGITGARFDRPAWYHPTSSIIYTGSALLVQNAFGAKQRRTYFCVIDAASGTLIKAGLPD